MSVTNFWSEPECVNVMQPGGPIQHIGISYRPARLHKLAESIPWNRFLCSLNVYRYCFLNSSLGSVQQHYSYSAHNDCSKFQQRFGLCKRRSLFYPDMEWKTAVTKCAVCNSKAQPELFKCSTYITNIIWTEGRRVGKCHHEFLKIKYLHYVCTVLASSAHHFHSKLSSVCDKLFLFF